MKVEIPPGSYIKKLEVNDNSVEFDFAEKKKVALLFISLNQNYWPYFLQVMEDCKRNFLPHHNVDYFVWSDMPEGSVGNAKLFPTDAIEWPAPTLMRYHLFLQQEELLKEYDYIFYLDADMRVVQKISDEILGTGLTAAEHPMYSLRKQYIPPYEPNPESTAYIHRPGKVVEENGRPRFQPYYYAGGFQGGTTKDFIDAMHVMRDNIDKDFNKGYTAIWNDESHWNKYLSDFKGDLVVLSPAYVYPDSLIKEYYEPIWGRSYEPKIITLTKPFTLSKDGGKALNEYLGKSTEPFRCPVCGDGMDQPGFKILRIIQCPGTGKPHQVDMQKI